MAARSWISSRTRTPSARIVSAGRGSRTATADAGARRAARPWAWSAAIAVVAFLFHAWAAGEVAGDKDSSEFTLVIARLGIPHPTGYPLYTLLGHGFGRALHALGVGWPRAASLWSALGGAIAIGALHAIAARLLARAGVRRGAAAIVALAPVLLFGANPVWTLEATVAEVGAWHVAWVALAVGAALALEDERAPVGPGRAAALGALLGAGLAHHLSSLLWSLPLGTWMMSRLGGERGARVPFVAGFLLLPVAGLGFLAWRATHPGEIHWPLLGSGAAALWDHVSGAQYRHYLGRFAPSPTQAALFTRFVLPSLVVAIAASVAIAVRRGGNARAAQTAVVRAVLAGVLLQSAFAFAYGVPDPTSYFLPVLAVGIASAPAALLAWAPGLRRRGTWAVAVAVVLAAAVVPRWIGLAAERRETFARFDALVRSMWTSIPDEPGFVLWADDMAWRLRQYQLLEGVGRSLVVVDPVLLTHPVGRARFARAHGFDPLSGTAPPALTDPLTPGTLADSVAHALNARTALPVYLFAPQVPSVRRLVKPAP